MKAILEILSTLLVVGAAIGVCGLWLWAMVEDELSLADEKQRKQKFCSDEMRTGFKCSKQCKKCKYSHE